MQENALKLKTRQIKALEEAIAIASSQCSANLNLAPLICERRCANVRANLAEESRTIRTPLQIESCTAFKFVATLSSPLILLTSSGTTATGPKFEPIFRGRPVKREE